MVELARRRGPQGLGRSHDQAQRLLLGHLAGQRDGVLARDPLQDDVADAGLDADAEDALQARVVHKCGPPGRVQGGLHPGVLGREDADGDGAFEREVLGAPQAHHGLGPHLLLQAVPAGEERARSDAVHHAPP